MSSRSLSTQTGGNTKCDVTVYYNQTASGAEFYFEYWGYAEAEWYAPGGKYASYWRWKGNDAGYVQMSVNGSYTNQYTFTNGKGSRNKAGDTGGPWYAQKSGTSNTLSLPGQNTPYTITVYYTGSMSRNTSFSVSYTFNLPVYVNDNGTIKPIIKAYINDGGTIRECDVYLNVNGTIHHLQ